MAVVACIRGPRARGRRRSRDLGRADRSARVADVFALDARRPAGLPAAQQGPVLLQFWASWCHSCGGLMWELDRLAAAHPQVPYLAVSIDADRRDAERATAHPLHARHPDRYLHDGDGALARRLAVQVVPTLVVLDASGRECLRHVGHVNSTDLQRLRAVLAGLVPASKHPHETAP
jgi:thiol-disulfide isomerase/thioredoxin